jgi:hypothetical protein
MKTDQPSQKEIIRIIESVCATSIVKAIGYLSFLSPIRSRPALVETGDRLQRKSSLLTVGEKIDVIPNGIKND